MLIDYPDDVTGEVLRRLELDGSDMSQPMKFDFAVECMGEAACQKFQSSINFPLDGFSYDYDDEYDVWTCSLDVVMVPDYRAIVSLEKKLNGLCASQDCTYAGFGSFGNISK